MDQPGAERADHTAGAAYRIDQLQARTDALRDDAGWLPWDGEILDRVLFEDVPVAVASLCRDDCDPATAEKAADLICQLLDDTKAIRYPNGGAEPEVMTRYQLEVLIPLAKRYAEETWVNRGAARRALDGVWVRPPWTPTDVSDVARRLSHPQ